MNGPQTNSVDIVTITNRFDHLICQRACQSIVFRILTHSSIAFFSLCLQNNVYNRGRERDGKHFSLSIDRSKTDQRYRSAFDQMQMDVRLKSVEVGGELYRVGTVSEVATDSFSPSRHWINRSNRFQLPATFISFLNFLNLVRCRSVNFIFRSIRPRRTPHFRNC